MAIDGDVKVKAEAHFIESSAFGELLGEFLSISYYQKIL
jgi:hypothetical protein